ncbi:hypothetical protein D3C76_774150 [compost metagenome]
MQAQQRRQPGSALQGHGAVEGVGIGLPGPGGELGLGVAGLSEAAQLEGGQPLEGNRQANEVQALGLGPVRLVFAEQLTTVQAGQAFLEIAEPEQGVGHGQVGLDAQCLATGDLCLLQHLLCRGAGFRQLQAHQKGGPQPERHRRHLLRLALARGQGLGVPIAGQAGDAQPAFDTAKAHPQ